MTILWFLIAAFLATMTFYLLFLVFAAYRGAIEAGRDVPWFSKAMIALPLLSGAILDVVWNLTLGSVLFLELPAVGRDFTSWTFTARLKLNSMRSGWRGRLARSLAKQLNWADVGHV